MILRTTMTLKKALRVYQVTWMIPSTETMILSIAGMIPNKTCMVTTPGMLVMMETVIGNTTIKIIIIGHSNSNFKVTCMSGINGMDGTRNFIQHIIKSRL